MLNNISNFEISKVEPKKKIIQVFKTDCKSITAKGKNKLFSD